MIWWILYAVSVVVALVVLLVIAKRNHDDTEENREKLLIWALIWPIILLGVAAGFGIVKFLNVLSTLADWIVERLEGI